MAIVAHFGKTSLTEVGTRCRRARFDPGIETDCSHVAQSENAPSFQEGIGCRDHLAAPVESLSKFSHFLRTIMQAQFAAITILFTLTTSALAADTQAQTCDQIRDQIEAQTGILPLVNKKLLQTLSLRQECRFSAGEVYRAAYGDKPLPLQTALAFSIRDRDVD
jgi:hypothetical protein